MGRVKKIVSDLAELYKKILHQESIEENSVDSFLDELEEQAAENKKKIVDLGFWTKDGEYKEDYQEVTENDTL